MYQDTHILLVGCGKMGAALMGGWEKSGVPSENILIIEPEDANAKLIQEQYGVEVLGGPEHVEGNFEPDIIVFAIKPQVMDEVLPKYVDFTHNNEVFLSIAAGKSLEYLGSQLGNEKPIVRAMPNLPATIGKGITALTANKKVDKSRKAQCTALMEAVGEVVWVEDEALMDMVTAISGSGPAYVFYIIEAMLEAAKSSGMDEVVARKLICETISGSANLAACAKEPLEQLREDVTSPGGTTEAALNILMDGDNFRDILEEAVKAAEAKSKQLNN